MRYWTCRRQAKGVVCGARNPAVKQRCTGCGKPRPKRQAPAHKAALDLPYETYVKLNGGDHCYLCERQPSAGRRLDRDHDHRTGQPRGLLCHRCNRALPSWTTPQWHRHAAVYLEIGVLCSVLPKPKEAA